VEKFGKGFVDTSPYSPNRSFNMLLRAAASCLFHVRHEICTVSILLVPANFIIDTPFRRFVLYRN